MNCNAFASNRLAGCAILFGARCELDLYRGGCRKQLTLDACGVEIGRYAFEQNVRSQGQSASRS